MIRINENYRALKSSYLFSEIAKRVGAFQEANPETRIIRMGIGDVTVPLPPAIIKAFHDGVDDMARADSFKGYGPEQGYDFLREKIAENDFLSRGATISADEIFISDGAKCDTGNFQELFAQDCVVGVPDPVYPVYVDTNVMAGRAGANAGGRYEKLVYMDCTRDNGFVPDMPAERVDLIYLCFPNNPTGATITHDRLRSWVEYAHTHKSLILYDAAYEAFIRDETLPRSIFEIEGAREVAVEFRSFSKTAGFTGTRCAFTVIPKECRAFDAEGNAQFIHALWNRRHTTKFNGVSYPVQRAAEAVYSPEGKKQVVEIVDYYLENARLVRTEMTALGYECTGGQDSPYIWVNTRKPSWEFFDQMLSKAGVVCTPGEGFGKCGEGFIRISAFNSRENVIEAMQRISRL
ncbi:MAG: LL-diaminopimelate aminotransferase [Spirochaetes bacterium]|nr:MAG: LL-diaminopimelate aminotransferase [Spirochaetota bacterium]